MTRRSFDSPRAAEIFNPRTLALLLTLHFCDCQPCLEIAHNASCVRACADREVNPRGPGRCDTRVADAVQSKYTARSQVRHHQHRSHPVAYPYPRPALTFPLHVPSPTNAQVRRAAQALTYFSLGSRVSAQYSGRCRSPLTENPGRVAPRSSAASSTRTQSSAARAPPRLHSGTRACAAS